MGKITGKFNNCKIVILFGHGGNMGVCDHGSIDIGRLTDKTTYSQEALLCASLISIFLLKNGLKNR